MASFIIHHTAGIEFLKYYGETNNVPLSEDDINNFLLGNLIVDSSKTDDKSRIQEEKRATHFRYKELEGQVVNYPNLEDFLEKYKDLVISDYSALGYFFHLYTDYMFFTYLFNKTFEFLDANGEETRVLANVAKVHIKKDDTYLELSEIFNGNVSGLYHDYTIMNKIVLDEFALSVDIPSLIEWAKVNFHNPGIEEVNYERIVKLLNDLMAYLKSASAIENKSLDVFREEDIIEFIRDVSKLFIDTYYKSSEDIEKDTKLLINIPNK